MSTTFAYSLSDFSPFTKILSADMNTKLGDVKSRFNWAGGSSTTTGLGDDNLQSNTVSGGGITRSSKLKAGTASYVLINDGTGLMSEEAQLAITRGGTGLNVVPASQSPGDVLQINAGSTAFTVSAPTGVPASLRIYQFYNFT